MYKIDVRKIAFDKVSSRDQLTRAPTLLINTSENLPSAISPSKLPFIPMTASVDNKVMDVTA